MTMTITEAFELPTRDEITALRFVIKLEDSSEEEKRRLIRDYVLTPQVRLELPTILKNMRSVYHQTGDLGRFIHGSFGSGKSHFMSILGLLCEGDALAWSKDDPLIQAQATEHRGWLKQAALLVVRLHMLSATRRGTGFDRAMYTAFNQALKRQGKAEFIFLNTRGVLDDARQEAARYGELFWQRMRDAGVAESAEHFEQMAGGSTERQERLSRQYLDFSGRNPDSAGLDPNWGEGLQRMATHARAQGFGGLVFLVDEFLLWLGEKDRASFVEAINQLNTLVDHNTGPRAVPIYVFVARQRNVKEFFPDMAQEDALHRHLDHHSKRFELTTLQDVDLRHIVRERVLRRRHPEAVQAVVDGLAERHRRLIHTLMRDVEDGVGYLKDVYPFHPALIEMLIDISSLMQRERSALRLLYELLVIHYPDLPLGEFLPVGSAFEAIFPEAGVEGNKRLADLKAVHQLYYTRFRPALDLLSRPLEEGGIGLPTARRRVLDQLIKTALLAEVSPRLKGSSGLDIQRLVQLNDADVAGFTERGKITSAYQDLVELSRKVQGPLQLSGQGGTALVGIVLQGVNFGELLARARTHVDNHNKRLVTFYSVLKQALGLANKPGLADGHEGVFEVRWRGTRRRGSIRFDNIRTMSNAQFRVRDGEEFRLIIDYPWDEPGHTADDDQKRAQDVRRRDGESLTLCWLPRHLTQNEQEVILSLAAARFLSTLEGQEELLRNLSASDRQRIVEQATSLAHTEETQLGAILLEVYKDHGRVVALISDVGPRVPETQLQKNLEHFSVSLLDRKYPSHPDFLMEPTPEALRKLCAWMVEADDHSNKMTGFDPETGDVLRKLGQPLELVDPPGQSRAKLRLDTRYVRSVLAQTESGSVSWEIIDRELESIHAFQPAVRNLFLAWLLQSQGFRAIHMPEGHRVTVTIDNKPRTGIRLERAAVLEGHQWSSLGALVPALFDLPKPSSHRSLAAQDRTAGQLQTAGIEQRRLLQNLHEFLARLAPDHDGRRADIRSVLERLKPLSAVQEDSHACLQQLLALWPDDARDPLRTIVRQAGRMLDAVEHIDEHTRSLVTGGVAHRRHGEACAALLAELEGMLGATEQEVSLTRNAIQAWNERARAMAVRLIAPVEAVDESLKRTLEASLTEERYGAEAKALIAEATLLLGTEASSETDDAIRDWNARAEALVRKLQVPRARLDETARGVLDRYREHKVFASEVAAVLETLRDVSFRGVSDQAILAWNARAQDLAQRILKYRPPKAQGTFPVYQDQRVSLQNGDDLGRFMGNLRRKLQALGHDDVVVDVIVKLPSEEQS